MMQHNRDRNQQTVISNERLLTLARVTTVEARRQRQIAMARRDRPDFDQLARWVVARCKSGLEQAIRDALTEQGIECWCPCERRRLPPRRRKPAITVERPLFRGYLFVRVIPDNEAYAGLLLASKLQSLMGQDGKPYLMPEALMRQLQLSARTAERQHMDAGDVPPVPDMLGKQVTIRSGPFADFVVTVRKVLSRRGQVVVDVPMFGGMSEVTVGVDVIAE
ncbi:transcriptional antiterminator [Agrobacterium vitis]|uniref:transcription termination/antitermination NusG family protein n=1 Tax=Rhizobium/Agrobacterium group TaxID=227290 RepID=UPI0008DC07C0|nr:MULTISPECIES: transcription termination/antitermination NusG family protein [Rhizobium/Agrobacterium group]MCF1433176.1 transcriptional antiterminator [Allorhizobium ampelinum]MUO91759.1 transcriptional antiterminator [Agrobacterium vitis]MUZ54740.1 transcriptional antiterminator [Agrobacterium vitis]MUZ93012.1 transcriptional antiterminator [Agrobacterium vitis]MVA41466.1 transcriptional antiterminator [Agrobacterium vitis]